MNQHFLCILLVFSIITNVLTNIINNNKRQNLIFSFLNTFYLTCEQTNKSIHFSSKENYFQKNVSPKKKVLFRFFVNEDKENDKKENGAEVNEDNANKESNSNSNSNNNRNSENLIKIKIKINRKRKNENNEKWKTREMEPLNLNDLSERDLNELNHLNERNEFKLSNELSGSNELMEMNTLNGMDEQTDRFFAIRDKKNIQMKSLLKKTKTFCNYLTSKLARLNKKLREIKKLETVFYTNPNILTETQKIKISKKKQIKNEIVLINRYRKKYLVYKKNLMKNINDKSPFFYSKKKTKDKRQICSQQEFRQLLQNPCTQKTPIQRIKKIESTKIPTNLSQFLIFNKVGTKEEIKLLFGLKAIKVNENIIDDENYLLNLKEDEVKVFDQIVHIHEDHYTVSKRLTKEQKQILKNQKKKSIQDAEKEARELEKFLELNINVK